MRIKHNKLRNTGLLFELLSKQITSDILSGKDSPAVSIVKNYFSKNSLLLRELKLYQIISTDTSLSQNRAESTLATLIEISRKLDRNKLRKEKYELVAEIKRNYNLDEFFAIQVKNYKPHAALYCLIEAYSKPDLVDLNSMIDNRVTVLEHLTSKKQEAKEVKANLIEEYSKYDKDLRILTFKILLEKFNKKYDEFLPEQKKVLREFINSVNSTVKLRTFVNGELESIKQVLAELSKKVENSVVKIKLEEVQKTILPLTAKDRVKDDHLIKLMQYYDLIRELKST